MGSDPRVETMSYEVQIPRVRNTPSRFQVNLKQTFWVRKVILNSKSLLKFSLDSVTRRTLIYPRWDSNHQPLPFSSSGLVFLRFLTFTAALMLFLLGLMSTMKQLKTQLERG